MVGGSVDEDDEGGLSNSSQDVWWWWRSRHASCSEVWLNKVAQARRREPRCAGLVVQYSRSSSASRPAGSTVHGTILTMAVPYSGDDVR